MAGELVPEGGWAIGVIFLPQALMNGMGLEITEDMALEDIYAAWSAATWDPSWGEYQAPDIKRITLDNGMEAAQSESLSDTEDVLINFFEISDGIYVLATIMTAPDGRTEQMTEQGMAVTNSIQFTGTVEDLLANMGDE